MLEFDRVTRRFGEVHALDALSFTVPGGSLCGFCGPNGAGKTTAKRALVGVLPLDEGEIRWRGDPVDRELCRRFGYLPEERGLYPAMEVEDHLVYLARLRGMAKERARRGTRRILASFDLEAVADRRIDSLSLGNAQRVQLASALVHDPVLVVLDEPFNGLDPVAVASLSETLRVRARGGMTVLFSSHQLDLVQDLCEDIVMIDDGRVVLSGAVATLRASSGGRQLRVQVDAHGTGWLAALPGVEVVGDEADALRLSIPTGTDPLTVLDAARAAGHVADFGLELPTLSQLFLAAAGRPTEVAR